MGKPLLQPVRFPCLQEAVAILEIQILHLGRMRTEVIPQPRFIENDIPSLF